MDPRTSPRNYSNCDRPAGHNDHLCRLMEKGKTALIAGKTRNVAYCCANCGACADQAGDLCYPRILAKR